LCLFFTYNTINITLHRDFNTWPSGSGKSSVVKAGLMSALRRGGLPGSARWFITEMLPGTHPLEELEAALLQVAVTPLPGLLEQLSEDLFLIF
jgi:hypothetical protein